MVGKPYRVPTAGDRLHKQQKQIKDLQAINRVRNTPRPVASTAFAGVSAAGSEGGTGNFLRTEGDTMIGPLALSPPVDFSVDIDADGILDIGESSSNSQYSSNIQIEDVPTSTTLDTIAGAAFDGQILVIRTFAPGSITIAQATLANGGNIQTPNDADFTMGNLEMISLVFDDSLVVFDNAPGGTWRVLTGDSTGGSGLTEPVILTVNEITPQTLPTTSVVDWSKNPNHITLDRDVEFSFDNLPVSGKYEGVLVIIDVDATGGFAAPVWPASLTNPPTVSTVALTRTSVMLYTIDGGTTVTHATSVGSSSSGSSFSGNLSDLTIDVTKNWAAQGISNFGSLTGVTGIDLDGATATIQGVKLIDLFQADQQIDSLSTGIEYTAGDLQSHLFKSQTNDIAKFEESASGVFRLDMLDHSVRDARDLTLSNSSGAIIFAGTSPALGFDSVAASLIINVPTGAKIAISENNVIGSTEITDDGVISDVITADSDLFIGVLGTSPPTVTGQFTNDATDVFVFSGGASRNLSNISTTVAATTELDNLTTTSINADLIPQAGKLLGSDGNEWSSVHTNNLRLGTAGVISTTSNQIFGDSGGVKFNVPTGLNFQWFFEGVSKWSMNATQLNGDFILLQNSLTFNDSGTNPIGDGELTRNGSNMLLEIPQFTLQNRTTTGSDVAELSLLKIDTGSSATDNIAELNFNVFDTPTTTKYARILAKIVDQNAAGSLQFDVRSDNVNNSNALTIEGSPNISGRTNFIFSPGARIATDLNFSVISGSSPLQIRPAVNQLGFTVNTEALTVGLFGSMKMPRDTGSSSSAAQADTDFGNVIGCYGLYTGDSPPLYVIKIDDSPTTWATLTLNASGTIGAGRLT